MKQFLIITTLFLLGLTSAWSRDSFDSSSTGVDWQRASLEYRAKYCSQMAAAFEKRGHVGITGDYLFESLQAMFKNSQNPENTKIVEAVALAVTIHEIKSKK